MDNIKITKKERGLIKGAIRRVFSRSELRQEVLKAAEVIGYSDPTRPRVKKWSMCATCKTIVPKYTCEVDHIDPVIPTNRLLESMTWDEVVDRIWCGKSNLQNVCEPCHKAKTKSEMKERVVARKKRKANGKS